MSKFDISIKKPCGENWSSFEKTREGGFCQRCQKNVIDFTKQSDREITAYFRKNPTNVCGRFNASQLKTYTVENERISYFSKAAAITAGLLSLSQLSEASVKDVSPKPPIEIVETPMLRVQSLSSTGDLVIIRGTVLSREDDSVLPGVNVLLKGTTTGTITDADGNFELKLEGRVDTVSLVFSFVGLQTVEYQVATASGVIELKNVFMHLDVTQLGGAFYRPWGPRGIWWKIKGLFSKNY